jgi:hypothetical protein
LCCCCCCCFAERFKSKGMKGGGGDSGEMERY